MALVAIVFLIYGNTLQHGYNLDDAYYINILPDKDASIGEVFTVFTKRFSKDSYRPIPTFHLALEQAVFYQSPLVFHFFNLIYYALLGVVIFILFHQMKLFKKDYIVFLLAAFFIIHPSHSNVVASIKNRDVILGMLYGLTAISFLLKFIDSKKIIYILISLLFFYIATLCKIDAVLFVAGAGVITYFVRDITIRKSFLVTISMVAIALALFFLSSNYMAEAPQNESITEYFENPMVTTESSFKNLPINIGLLSYYHKFMVVPTGYYFYFGYNQISIPKINSPFILIACLLHLLVLILATMFLLKRKKNSLLLGLTLYTLFLVPFLWQMQTTAGIIAVRYSFNASLGFSIIVLSTLVGCLKYKNLVIKNGSKLIFGLIILCFSYFTIDRNKDWENKETLFTNDLKYLKKSYMANRLGGIFFLNEYKSEDIAPKNKKRHLAKAEKYFAKAERIYVSDPILWQNKGLLNMEKENYKNAFLNFRKAIEVDSSNIDSWQLYADFSEFAGDNGRAEQAYRKIISIDDDNLFGYRKLTFNLIDQQKLQEAINVNQQLLQKEEMAKHALENLGHIHIIMGDTLVALSYFDKAFVAGLINEDLQKELDQLSNRF